MTATEHHPAQFSPPIIETLRHILKGYGLPVHDPFAGPGVRLGKLCDELGLHFTGTEIEPEFIEDRRVWLGDSTIPETYPPERDYLIVTSPAYPNGMADHFHAQDGSQRHTYRQAATEIAGEDCPLHLHNMGRHGARSGAKVLTRHFDIARSAVANWPPHPAVVNVSDFIMKGRRYELVDDWAHLLGEAGYIVAALHEVETRRQRHGANADLRVDHEVVLVAEWVHHG